jgi:hypothetical protein
MRLCGSRDFETLVSLWADWLAEADKSLRRGAGADLHVAQGRSLTLEELVKLPETARQTLTPLQVPRYKSGV